MEEFNAAPFTSIRPFMAPNPQKEDIERDVKNTLEQLPVLREVLKHFDEQIKYFDSIDSITVDLSKDPALFQKEHAANCLAKAKLQAERTFILAKLERVVQHRRKK